MALVYIKVYIYRSPLMSTWEGGVLAALPGVASMRYHYKNLLNLKVTYEDVWPGVVWFLTATRGGGGGGSGASWPSSSTNFLQQQKLISGSERGSLPEGKNFLRALGASFRSCRKWKQRRKNQGKLLRRNRVPPQNRLDKDMGLKNNQVR